MEQTTTQSPPAKGEKAQAEKPANSTKPLPATEEDFHTNPSRTQSSGFRIGVVIAVLVLLIAGFFAYRYLDSYESTDDAQVDGWNGFISAYCGSADALFMNSVQIGAAVIAPLSRKSL